MKFYVTTPVYYVNALPHLGHAYSTIAADVLARFHRMRGDEVFFLTGTDEHGQKIAEAARTEGVDPKTFTDRMAKIYAEMWQNLDIRYDRFIRTTNIRHEQIVKKVFSRLREQGDIYPAEYRGFYCVPCESYVQPKTESGAPSCPDCGRPVQELNESSYFFRLSAYQQRIKDHIAAHPSFILPEFRRNEVLGFLGQQLRDLSFTRRTVSWGIQSPTPEGYPIYVWVDALINYLSGVGYLEDEGEFARFWPPDVQIIGKDIIRFHDIIWPAMLMALGLPLPRTIFAHGWWVVGKDKMSKSKGNIVSPRDLSAEYGACAVRFFLMREIPFGMDGEFSDARLRKRYNSDLANDFGNLVNRTLNLVEKKCAGRIPSPSVSGDLDALVSSVVLAYEERMERCAFHEALDEVWRVVTWLNRHLDEAAPWRLEGEKAGAVLYHVCEGIRVCGLLLHPFMPASCARVREMLGLPALPEKEALASWRERIAGGIAIGPRCILFPRKAV